MKHWQIGAIVIVFFVLAWAILAYPPGSRVIVQDAMVVPAPWPSLTPTPEPAAVSLLFAGDIMLSRSVGELMRVRNNWVWPFEQIASVTRAADLAFANLETTVSTRGVRNGCGYCFHSDPRVMAGLVYAGFDLVSVANNHVWDYGPIAFTDTLDNLVKNSISAVGGGWNIQAARGPVARTVRGTRVAYLAYTNLLPAGAGATETRAGANLWNMQRMTEDIVRARGLADVVVVSFHGGTEYQTTHNPSQETIYHAAIDSGADLIIGSHPHVVQDFERYKTGWIFYSLGNFVFDQNFSLPTRMGEMISVTVTGRTITDVREIPVLISTQYQPSVSQ